MRLWRLSNRAYARTFDGGYGLANDGRWNTVGRPITYASDNAALTALEKRVHTPDGATLPPLRLVEYDLPDDVPVNVLDLATLPADWTARQADTQAIGNTWLDAITEAVLVVPSVLIPIAAAPDRNYLINHRHADAARITIVDDYPFTLDPRLF
jgi:RES domain-containing protein